MRMPKCPVCKADLVRIADGRIRHPKRACLPPEKQKASWRAMSTCVVCQKGFPRHFDRHPRSTCSDDCLSRLKAQQSRAMQAVNKANATERRMRGAA